MVQLISTLSTTAAVLSLALSVSALPASPSEGNHNLEHASAPAPTANKRDGPFVVQARSVAQKAKRGYVGGGSGKTLRQAPMMKPARMVKAKRGMQERSDHSHEHIHEHIHTHEHDRDHHRHDGDDYDPHHSEHWNYHHNRIDHDGHGHHHHERDLINLEVLNIGSGNRKTVYSGHNYQVNTGHNNRVKNIKNHKRSPLSDLFARSSKKKNKSKGGKKTSHAPGKEKDSGEHTHPKIKAAIKKPSAGDKKHKEDKEKRHHNDHYDHDHDHLHVHEHEHDHDHIHEHSHIHARDHDRHRDHSDHWYEHHDLDRHHHHEHDHEHEHVHLHEHIHSHNHRRRDLAASGVPGFVEVASTFAHSSLAKSVAGLVFSKDPNSNSSDFVLGTSDSQSTQFYLAPITSAASASAGQNSSDPSTSVSTYQLRIPVLDSGNLRANDYCATFDINPPSPLSMRPCGDIEGFSQVFSYNTTTGELTPVYPATSTQPKPLNAAVRLGSPRILAAQAGGTPADSPTPVLTSATDALASTAPLDTLSLPSQIPASQTVSAPSATTSSAPGPAETPRVALYFVPSSGFYEEATTIDSLAKAGQSSFDETSSTVSAAVPVPTPTVFNPALVGGIKAVDYEGDDHIDDDTYYTTVTITTTISADEAGPTDGAVYGGDERNNAVIADSAEGDDYYGDSA